jgi:membrane glycosyltransferase
MATSFTLGTRHDAGDTLRAFLTAVFDRGYRLGIDPDKPLPTVHSRTALLMPTYNEDPRRLLMDL